MSVELKKCGSGRGQFRHIVQATSWGKWWKTTKDAVQRSGFKDKIQSRRPGITKVKNRKP